MIRIEFDGVPIPEHGISGLKTEHKLYDQTFKLGAVTCRTFEISIAKETIENDPTVVTIYDDDILLSTLYVDEKTEDDFNYVYSLMDGICKLDFGYDASGIIEANGSVSLLQILNDICSKAGITHDVQQLEYEKNVSWYDNTISGRSYVGFIAECNGCYAYMKPNGVLSFAKVKQEPTLEVDLDNMGSYKIFNTHHITRVVFDLGVEKFECGDETGDTVYLNTENTFIVDQNDIQSIYEQIHGFSFTSMTTSGFLDYMEAGTVIRVVDPVNHNEFITIAQQNLDYGGGYWYGDLTLNVESGKQEETMVLYNQNEKVKRLKTIVNRQESTLTILAESIDSAESKLSEFELTTDAITTKVSQIEDNMDEMISSKLDGMLNDVLDVGGRNLALNSEEEVQDVSEYTYTISQKGITRSRYTLSFDVRTDIDCLMDVTLDDDSGEDRISIEFVRSQLVTDKWKRMQFTKESAKEYAGNDNIFIRFKAVSDGGRFYLKNVKLEKGNIATDYTQAPEDIQNQFEQVDDHINDVVTSTSSDIQQTKDEINMMVQENYYSKDRMDEELATLRSDIVQTASDITISFEQYAQMQNELNQEYDNTVRTWIQADSNGLTFGKSTSEMKNRITNDRQSFGTVGADGTMKEQSYFTPNEGFINNLVVGEDFTMSGFQWKSHNGNYGLKKV